jgi:hypothetical protein
MTSKYYRNKYIVGLKLVEDHKLIFFLDWTPKVQLQYLKICTNTHPHSHHHTHTTHIVHMLDLQTVHTPHILPEIDEIPRDFVRKRRAR